MNLSSLLAQQGLWDAAMGELYELLKHDLRASAKARVHVQLAGILEEAGDPREAVEHYRFGAEADPELREAVVGLARGLARQTHFAEAGDRFGDAVELDPENAELRFSQGLSLVLAERYVEARAALERAVVELPDYLRVQHLLARLLAACPDPAVRSGERALQLASGVVRRELSVEHAETVAMALAELGRFADAIDLQRQVLARVEAVASPATLAAVRQRLRLYERGEPCRSPWKS